VVAVFLPLRDGYTYRWPAMLGAPEVGIRVRVPFGKSIRHGMVIELAPEQMSAVDIVDVLDRLDIEPLLCEVRLRWLRRSTRYYLSSFGEMLDMATAWADDARRKFRCVDQSKLEAFDSGLARLFPRKAYFSLATLRLRAEFPSLQYALLKALQANLIEEKIAAGSDASDWTVESIPEHLTRAQDAALSTLRQQNTGFHPSLLFGATGSGKTEVYLRFAAELVVAGKQVMILVPEIGLTPMWISRLQQRFNRVAMWHSAMKPQERIAVRHALAEVDVLIGTRSALFLPLPRLGLVVLDEEHDSSFKQQDGVNYSARDMALLLGQELDIPVLMGTATPSMESWRQVQQASVNLLELSERIASIKNPHLQPSTCEIVDMRGNHSVISTKLLSALEQTRKAGLQSILFLNRRGYAPALQCTACGHVPECPHCTTRLTLHRKHGQLRCHTCDYSRRVAGVCEACGEASLLPLGAGTEKLEDLLGQQLPELRFARFDRDEVRNHDQLQQVLYSFAKGELDCLVGTQMLVKGHHFPKVALVGVVNADMGIHMPDFRATERWWQQMTQVMGRAGRGDVASRIMIQTSDPDAQWINQLGNEAARLTLDRELSLRQMLNFPPYARWVRVVFSCMQADKALQAAQKFYDQCVLPEVRMTSPAPCAMERRAGRYRFEVLLRDETRKILPWKLAPLLQSIKVASGVRRKVEVDPVDML